MFYRRTAIIEGTFKPAAKNKTEKKMKTKNILLTALTIIQTTNTYTATLNGMDGYDCFNFLCLGVVIGITYYSFVDGD